MLDTVKSVERQVMLNHLKELMADASIYGWEPVRAYHGVWLQQLENRRAEWHNTEFKLEFRRALVWSPTLFQLPLGQKPLPCTTKETAGLLYYPQTPGPCVDL